VSEPIALLILVLLIIIGIAQILMPFYVIAINSKLRTIVAAIEQSDRAARAASIAVQAPAGPAEQRPTISLAGATRTDTSARERIERALPARYGVPGNYVTSYVGDWLGLVSDESVARLAEQNGQIVVLEDLEGGLHCFRAKDAISALRRRG
jgi:hypothetical protein